eukprot:6181821-Pleurochrysis_carterae.AAC.6
MREAREQASKRACERARQRPCERASERERESARESERARERERARESEGERESAKESERDREKERARARARKSERAAQSIHNGLPTPHVQQSYVRAPNLAGELLSHGARSVGLVPAELAQRREHRACLQERPRTPRIQTQLDYRAI